MRPIILGVSFKLYLDVDSTVQWAKTVAGIVRTHPALKDGGVRLFVLPSLPAVPGVVEALRDTPVGVGAQDLFWEDRGAFTGAVSGTDLRAVGCTYAEVGHAERRALFGDDDEIVRRKLAAALRNGLTPILCVGETVKSDPETAARETAAELEAVTRELPAADGGHDLIVAYEPRWAIGQAEAADADQVGTVIERLRQVLEADGRVGASSVLYGGSAQPGTLSTLRERTDGLFLGRFAHDPHRFGLILDEAAALRDSQLRTG
ncbi:triosephosphate isomerase [Sinomonas humi]|uniref:Triosephosphate isomerase n=1 Tax=Sinomonas humi TaxID=1338436 RepID=A0A0B2AR91_9MICC|nr:triosephosphate isomerase [Sinomonas humi]